ncbi:subtilase family protein [Striga asiatica]|uniref:Subtilase family protein n=1 Tax=Striga asiatica TaxID=4170 RepID=A0A5A7RIT1_STRAF|nr:subtilase family protein [Striga asiatica]
MKPSVFPEVHHWYEAILGSLVEDSNNNNINNNPSNSKSKTYYSSKLIHVYSTVFHGFSARLTPWEAQQLEEQPGVVAVFPDVFSNTKYTVPNRLLTDSDFGSSVTIGFLDNGIQSTHRSFNDSGLKPLPAGSWKGACTAKGVECNNKVIGAWSINNANVTDGGHGTHTASTAAGSAVENVLYGNNTSATAVGVAPKARIASYKVCDGDKCVESDVVAGLEKAVEDGVDIISMSLGPTLHGPSPYENDPLAVAAFGAMARGISVIASAGDGWYAGNGITNVAPWMTTVTAGTIDRSFPADLVFVKGELAPLHGASLYGGAPLDPNPCKITYAGLCNNMTKANFTGMIVMCDSEFDDIGNGRLSSNATSIEEFVKRSGGVGVVVAKYYPLGRSLMTVNFTMPGLVISELDREKLFPYLQKNNFPLATMIFRDVEFWNDSLAPEVADLSSRGPNSVSSYVVKPDVMAPGVDIIAAWPEDEVEFKMLSGTSMACAHVSGVAALLKGAHPEWSPAMIRSAMMTTAYTQANDGKAIVNPMRDASIFDMGAGHIDPEKAHDPGLVYDIAADDYVDFLCASNYTNDDILLITNRQYETDDCSEIKPWDLNYPAISIDSPSFEAMNRNITVERTVTNVGEVNTSYSVTVSNPQGVTLTVNPMTMNFSSMPYGNQSNYRVTITATESLPDSAEGKIVWSDGKRQVASPVVIIYKRNVK